MRRRGAAAVAVAAMGAEAVLVRRRTGRFGGRLAVRCGRGHVFRTLWIPGVSLTPLRLGARRVQWCPVGRHVSLVRPVGSEET